MSLLTGTLEALVGDAVQHGSAVVTERRSDVRMRRPFVFRVHLYDMRHEP